MLRPLLLLHGVISTYSPSVGFADWSLCGVGKLTHTWNAAVYNCTSYKFRTFLMGSRHLMAASFLTALTWQAEDPEGPLHFR